ncbi:MAG: hypothetical protein Q8N90_01755, partial [bacterium]|nr:hypothetical protein [bacterium]
RWEYKHSSISPAAETHEVGSSTGQEVHHILNSQLLLGRYRINNSFDFDSARYNWHDGPETVKVVHHTLERRTLLDPHEVAGNFEVGWQHHAWRNKPIQSGPSRRWPNTSFLR